MGRGQKLGVFCLSRDRPASATASYCALDAGHTGADAIEVSVGADGQARIVHTDKKSGGLGRAKSGTGLPT